MLDQSEHILVKEEGGKVNCRLLLISFFEFSHPEEAETPEEPV